MKFKILELSEESHSDSDSEDEIEYHGLLGKFYQVKDYVEDAIERAQESETVNSTTKKLKAAGAKGWDWTGKGGRVLWVVGTTLVVMVLPLVLEVEREQGFIEAQQQQEAMLRQQGYTSQQLQQMGFGQQPR